MDCPKCVTIKRVDCIQKCVSLIGRSLCAIWQYASTYAKITQKLFRRNIWVVAGLGVVTADLPQRNDLSGVLRHGATKGCHACTVEKHSYTDNSTDIIRLSRYKQCTD
ncbi:hypothetical protein RhiirA1_487165 [Rhizophagus irregularis]|uniref:Uncharacterized protein n=1 Tax=Rhizophagus irregularis TaxID=588596 RepID=A0A2N0QGH3_9GLOM|nr:hypothetical protein RhiirA1_487165 [Rhizophagus irregularis]